MNEQKVINKKVFIPLVGIALLLLLGRFFLKEDFNVYLIWSLLLLLLGLGAMPLSNLLFAGFQDKGWIFSKVLGLALTGWLTWLLVSLKLLKFTQFSCVLVSVVLIVLLYAAGFALKRRKKVAYTLPNVTLVLWEELLFLGFFLIWTYVAGFSPAAYGTEKFMDYGFMAAMMRSDVLPFRDIWYSEGTVNYYYGGQYFATFLTKISGTHVEQTYNLARTMIAGMSFAMPFSLVYQLAYNRNQRKAERTQSMRQGISAVTGFLAGAAVSLAGNMHYVIYAKILPFYQKLMNITTEDTYWYPDSTRYIGYNPDVADKTIHEFPCYSFVLGDLHAHVVNLLFVMTILAVFYGLILWVKEQKKSIPYKNLLFWVYIGVLGLLLGLFQWNNYWDYIIYFTVALIVCLYCNVILTRAKWKYAIMDTGIWLIAFFLISKLVVLPFTLNFVTMVQGVGVAQNHSFFYQLLILWGLPTVLVLFYTGRNFIVFHQSLKNNKKRKHAFLSQLLVHMEHERIFVMIIGLCAIGLVVIPEIVYVKDIYGDGYSRANTMFKLTYQAFVMFGMAMAYILVEFLDRRKEYLTKGIGIAGMICLLCTVGYFPRAVHDSMGDLLVRENYQGLDATRFLETNFPEDVGGIRWLMDNVEEQPVVLEAQGDSYTDYERVSAMTGLPTICGWYVHEWLWRNDTDDLNVKGVDIQDIYTSTDTARVEALLEQYQVSYIFVGKCEREKYPDIQEQTLRTLGEIVYQNNETGNYIIKVK